MFFLFYYLFIYKMLSIYIKVISFLFWVYVISASLLAEVVYTANPIASDWVTYGEPQKLSSLDTNLALTLGLNFSTLLFLIGLFGILWNQRNIIITFLCVELMLFGAGLQFLFYYLFFNYVLGQIVALLILTVATSETAIGLGIIILAYRQNRSVSFEAFTVLKG
jgi:NADH-quinone oxidoreductase subunit K